MTVLPPAPPPVPAPVGGWPTEPSKPVEPAGPRSQLAVGVVVSLAIVIVCGATGTLGWGIAACLALAAGIAVAVVGDLQRIFESIPGFVAAVLTMVVLTIALAIFSGSGSTLAFVPIAGAFVLGLDWTLVRRLRPLPFASGFLVLGGVSGGETWTYPAALAWLALALGALASLEADRRAAQPQVVAVNPGPASTDVRGGDLATTILVALAIALLAALVLSTPSCHRSSDQARSDGSGQTGQGQTGENGGQGGGQGGQGGQGGTGGQGQTGGNGGRGGQGGQGGQGGTGGQGTGADHLYVPDPDGQFLVPNEGGGTASRDDPGVPSPDLLPDAGGSTRRRTLDDGTTITASRDADGTGRITVTDPDGTSRTYTYRDRSDGLVEIQGDESGRTLYYDPQGKIATDDTNATGGADPGPDPEPEKTDDAQKSHLDGRLLVLLVLVLAALGALAWWWSTRRKDDVTEPGVAATAPPWALRLAREIGREGAARGRPRQRSESLVAHARSLCAGPLPDERVVDVADVVSTALFGRGGLGPDAQRWAESTWEEILAAHPAPSRAERRRTGAGTAAP